MPISLHAAIVPGWLQILGSCHHLIGKAEEHCSERGLDPAELIGARLIEDMLPLAYQLKSCRVHTQGAIEGVRRGTFSPDMTEPPSSFPALAARIDEAMNFLGSLDPAELDSLADKEMAFVIPNRVHRKFTVRDFLLGFSQPNFYFHATTTYAILRSRGVGIGKIDYLGAMPVKG